MEENSGVSFLEAQAALAKQWIGTPYPDAKDQGKVFIKAPSAEGEGVVVASWEGGRVTGIQQECNIAVYSIAST